MKYYYRNSSREPARWETGFNNIKFVLAEALEAVAYMHSNGFVHRDLKGELFIVVCCIAFRIISETKTMISNFLHPIGFKFPI